MGRACTCGGGGSVGALAACVAEQQQHSSTRVAIRTYKVMSPGIPVKRPSVWLSELPERSLCQQPIKFNGAALIRTRVYMRVRAYIQRLESAKKLESSFEQS
jgi:hypothetical protein